MFLNGVPMVRHGLVLGEDEAATTRKLFKHLPGPPGPIFGPKKDPNIQTKTYMFFPKAPPEQGSRLDFGAQGLASALLVGGRWVVISSRRNYSFFKTYRFVETT